MNDISIGDVPVIDIQTVYDYGAAINIPLKVEEFPCVKPPFEHCVLVFRTRSVDSNTKERLDCRCVVIDNTEAGHVGVGVNLGMNGRWIGVATFATEYDERGAPTGDFGLIDVRNYEPLVSAPEHISTLAACALNAISFMHVKGARIDKPEFATRQQRRQWERSKQQVKVLRIEPLERVMRQYRDELKVAGGSRRVHLVRGHFKDFSNGNGVGGNPNARGLYWTPPHIRGHKEKGIVAKQYETGRVAG